MSRALVPRQTKKNHPEWVQDPLVNFERSYRKRSNRRGLQLAMRKGSGQTDMVTPEAFEWARRPGALTSAQINALRASKRIEHENLKISRELQRIRSSAPQQRSKSSMELGAWGGSAQTPGASMSDRMFASLQRLPDKTFRRLASTTLTPSLSATLLLVGRSGGELGGDAPRPGGQITAADSTGYLSRRQQGGMESLEKRKARRRGGQLLTIDRQNRRMNRRIAEPKRVSRWAGGEPTNAQAMARWYQEQSRHMRRGCDLPYLLPPPRRVAREDPVAALLDSAESSAVLDRFLNQARARAFESDAASVIDGDDDGGYAMERMLLGQNDASVYDDVKDALPELLVARRRRLMTGFETWRNNVRLMRKYRRIFMARIMRMNRQRLERCVQRWVAMWRFATGRDDPQETAADAPLDTKDLRADNREEMEAVWAAKAAAKAEAKRLAMLDRMKAKKDEERRKKKSALVAAKEAAVARESELQRVREEKKQRRMAELQAQMAAEDAALKREREREISEAAKVAAAQQAASARDAVLERASDHVLGALANQRAEDAAKKSLQKPDLRDEAAEMKALEEGKAAHTTHSHRTDLS